MYAFRGGDCPIRGVKADDALSIGQTPLRASLRMVPGKVGKTDVMERGGRDLTGFLR
jgi:hypothetical protein